MVIKDSKIYDILKWVSRYAIPSLITMYVALSKVWGWENCAEIVATMSAINVCLSTLLGVSNENYSKQINPNEKAVEEIEGRG